VGRTAWLDGREWTPFERMAAAHDAEDLAARIAWVAGAGVADTLRTFNTCRYGFASASSAPWKVAEDVMEAENARDQIAAFHVHVVRSSRNAARRLRTRQDRADCWSHFGSCASSLRLVRSFADPGSRAHGCRSIEGLRSRGLLPARWADKAVWGLFFRPRDVAVARCAGQAVLRSKSVCKYWFEHEGAPFLGAARRKP
jgi:hypothetical protein